MRPSCRQQTELCFARPFSLALSSSVMSVIKQLIHAFSCSLSSYDALGKFRGVSKNNNNSFVHSLKLQDIYRRVKGIELQNACVVL